MTPPELISSPIVADEEKRLAPSLAQGKSGGRPPIGLRAILRKYSKIVRVTLTERLTYRADFLIGTFVRFLPTLTTILLWKAIFAGAPGDQISGFGYNEMISYLLLVNISRMFSSMPGLASGISRDIREGTIKKYLTQPIDLIGYLISYRMAHKGAYILTAALPYALLFYLCRSFFVGLVPTDPITWLAFLAALLMAFLIGVFFEICVGMVGFWFLEVTSLLYIVMTLNFFVSGHMFPLDLLPPPWEVVLKILPFQYLAYFPAVVFLGKVQGAELVGEFAKALGWLAFFVLLSRWMYRRGLRRYSAFGG